jgi:hypothetical protein
LHDPDLAVAMRRSRNASRAATLGNSKIGTEIRSMRLMVRELVETTVSGDLDPLVRKRLAELVQLVQSYCRLAELEIAAGEKPKSGGVALPEDVGEHIRRWAEGEAEGSVHGEPPGRRQGSDGSTGDDGVDVDRRGAE